MSPLWVLVLLLWTGVATVIHVHLEQDGRIRGHGWIGVVICLLWPVLMVAPPLADRIAFGLYQVRVRWWTWRVERELRRYIARTPSTLLSDPERALVFRNIPDLVEALLDGRAPELEELLEDDETRHGED